jgi:HK97 family phage prohead protease
MPMKPHKGESQSDFMSRCVPEMMGDGKREQDQAVAACAQIWRDKDKMMKNPAKEYADPGYQADGKKRFAIDTKDQVRVAWSMVHNAKLEKNYTVAQLSRIEIRITNAWKILVDPSGPPAIDDIGAMQALRKTVVKIGDAPDVEEGESHDDYMDRCMEELGAEVGGDSPDDDEAEIACEEMFELSEEEKAVFGSALIMHKTHAEAAEGMEFILSDATADRFGDIVEVNGWDFENFKKNPIALFGHNSSFPIGKWKNIRINEDKDLRAELQLAPKGTSDRIDEIRKLIEADILRATSVGFRPLDHAPINSKDPWGGTRYTKQELVECSLVSVPANPNALAVAKSLNISPSTVRMVFGEDASKGIVQRSLDVANRGEHADNKRGAKEGTKTGEHAERNGERAKGQKMLLSQRIQEAEKNLLALQDNLDKHLEGIDDGNPSEDQMVLTEDFTAKIEVATRHLKNLKAIETRNAGGAQDVGDLEKRGNGKAPANVSIILPKKKVEPLDFLVRAALVRCKSKIDGATIDDTRRKIYGDDEATRVMCDLMLKAASAPAMTTVTGWAAELVQTIWAAFMEVLLPVSVYPRLSAAGLSLTFGAAGKIIIPTRNLTPSISGSFVGEGQPIPVRQGAFSSQQLTPKKMAVITTWTREMDEHSIPAIEGLLRQAILDDTAISLDTVLLDVNPATAIRPPGLRSYQAGLTPSAVATNPFANFVADFKSLYGALLTLTSGNVRNPVIMLNPTQVLGISLIQPPNAATTLFPFMTMIDGGKILKVGLIESATVPVGMAIMVDAADFTTAGAEGPRLEISDQATLHMEDTTPQDIVGGGASGPTVANPVKSMWQTDSLALRLIMHMNWIMRRPVVSWMTGVQWG